MSLKRILIISLASSALASLAGVAYYMAYTQALVVSYSKVIGPVNVIVACTIGCALMGTGYFLAKKLNGKRLVLWLNFFYTAVSFISIIGVFSFSLPLDAESPELFPGLVIPMHFFPVLAFMSILPLLKNEPADK